VTLVLDRPALHFERGTSPGRHPYFALADFGGIDLPPDCKVTTFDPEPEPERCPRCGDPKEDICSCGFAWGTDGRPYPASLSSPAGVVPNRAFGR
jgi:hypothetical protein